MLGHDRLQGGDGIRWAPGRHQELCLALPCGHAELVQPQGLGLRERPAGEFAEGRAAPQAEGPIENPEGRPGGRGRGLGQGILEPCRIELGALHVEPVPALDGDEAVAGRAERAPQPRDLRPQGTGRVPGKRLAPQAWAERAADRVERERGSAVPDVVAGVLRYRAAEARVTAARATVGGAVRSSEQELRAARSISPLAGAIGISREFLYRVLAGDEWTWPRGPRTRPPGSRLPDTPVTTLAAYTVDRHQFALVSYTDTAGGKCVAVDQDGERGPAVRDVEVSAKDLVNAGMTMASKTMGQGLAAVYGRAHDSVTGLYAVMRSGERVAWPIHYDPRNQERYFAVIADCQQLTDIVAVAGRRRTSLKGNFGIWFRAAP
jgi:hypothetical protein